MIAVQLTYQNPDPERIALRPQHRDRLQQLTDDGLVFGAGPWADDSGALVVFDTDSREKAEELVAADPYFNTPGVSVVAYHDWNVVFRG
ncbi:YciI family protein [Microlunatus soli]|uniref:YCII-related domain-containing protein n=1 Tax=Microlunatus soli TaxID=630515 RepID=A0A1H1XP90_9ACTN|nr:YciI family protein [Microlunatus soli]SDT10871.1 hypothetical protein SAMN04489812_4169 [Microlunatus soli]